MSKYTIELRNIVSTFGRDEVKKWFMDYELEDYLTADEIAVITERGTWSKEKLADRIIDHYFIREIGHETPSLFKHQAKVAMQEIMEEKLPLIYSASIKYDPLVNVDFTETLDRATTDDVNSRSNTSGVDISSDTPQGQISKSAILQGRYASSASANENESSDSSNGAGTEKYTKHQKGNSGVLSTAQKLIQQYRDNIRMINKEIIDDLSELFMMIY